MPKIIYKGKTFTARWPKEIKTRLLELSERYKTRGFVDWCLIKANDELSFLPEHLQNTYMLSRYCAHVKRRANSCYRGKQKAYTPEQGKQAYGRFSLYKEVPEDIRIRNNFRKRRMWLDNQLAVLKSLVFEYTTNDKIQWERLIKDKKALKLPHLNLKRLKAYYHHLNIVKHPLYLERERARARKAKKKSLFQKAFVSKARKSTEEFLWGIAENNPQSVIISKRKRG